MWSLTMLPNWMFSWLVITCKLRLTTSSSLAEQHNRPPFPLASYMLHPISYVLCPVCRQLTFYFLRPACLLCPCAICLYPRYLVCNTSLKCYRACTGHSGVSEKSLFKENQKQNPPSISLGVSLEGSKRMFDFDKVLGCLWPLLFWPFLHWRFSLSLLSTWPWGGRVKIYNVKVVKLEVARGTPKRCWNQKLF